MSQGLTIEVIYFKAGVMDVRWFVAGLRDEENTLLHRTRCISYCKQEESTKSVKCKFTYVVIGKLHSQINMEKARCILARSWLKYSIGEFQIHERGVP